MTVEEMAGQMTQININEIMLDNKHVDLEKVRRRHALPGQARGRG